MAKLIVRGVREGDVEAIAANLRNADLSEIAALHGASDAVETLQVGVRSSSLVWTIEVDGEPAGLFGVAPHDTEIGVPWMLGTDALTRAPKQLTKLGRTYTRRMSEKYTTLLNYVDARNVKSIYWLSCVGFTVKKEAEPYGPMSLPFHRFWMNR